MFIDLVTRSKQALRLRFELARDLLRWILDCCSGVRAAGDLEEVVVVRGFVGRVRVCEEDCGEGGGEDGLRRFAGWKKSVRGLEEAIFIPFFTLK